MTRHGHKNANHQEYHETDAPGQMTDREKMQQLIFRRRRLMAVGFLAVLIFAFASIQLKMTVDKAYQAKQISQEVAKNSKALTVQTESLKKQVKLLEDEDYVAKLARSKFYYSKEGESVYTVPENNNDETNEGNQSSSSDILKSTSSQSK